jgi:uncharacterized membrane protein
MLLKALKTLSFGIVHVTVAFTVVYWLTGDAIISGAAAVAEPVCNTVAYHFHEVVWDKIRGIT